ncbi:beta-microseminoprotein-like [Phaethornis superciliosus]
MGLGKPSTFDQCDECILPEVIRGWRNPTFNSKGTFSTTGCYDSNGKLHKFDFQWRDENCNDCSCSKDGMSCCSSFATPVGYNEEKCVSIFNKETCAYKVVEKDDHSKECPVSNWVG